jgi:uncharacterized protein (UPF0332 family)
VSESPYNPESFLELGKALLEDSDYDEKARVRTAIGRAYYAAFLKAREHFKASGASFESTPTVHRQLIELLKSRKASLGDQLATLRTYRNKADYNLDSLFTIHIGRSCLEISRIIIDSLKRS